MDWKLEVVPIPVTDVDRAKAFYAEQVGFVVDLDTWIGEGVRLVQLTPLGSACSIHLNTEIAGPAPGSLQGLMLAVSDIDAARAELVERGVAVTRSSTTKALTLLRGEAEDGTHSSSSAIRTATVGSFRRVPRRLTPR